MRTTAATLLALNILLAACGWADPRARPVEHAREPVVGGPCEGCEDVFNGIPSMIASVTRIAPQDAKGAALSIEGTVRDAAGRPAPGVIVYAYQTDASGIYPRADPGSGGARSRHGLFRAWAKSDATGRYQFDTIRPGSYPGSTIPAHVHMHVIEPGRFTYVIDDLLFDDDPHLTVGERSRLRGRGGSGVAVPRREGPVWVVTRDIVLGEEIPDYPTAK